MALAEMHREDIKAALRKQYGTLRRFEEAHGLSRGAVHEVLRNRRWAKVERAIEGVIFGPGKQSEKTDSKAERPTHGLSAGAK